MKAYQLVLSSMACLSLMTARASAGAFLFEVRSVPVSDQACPQAAQAVAARLSAVAQVKIHRAYCVPERSGINHVQVVYEASQALTSIDSIDHNEVDAGLGKGIYKTLNECQGDLARQQVEFATMTGSKVVSAFCSQDWFNSSHPFSPSITAVVTDPSPHPRLVYKTFEIFGRAPWNADSVAQSLENQLRESGVRVRRVVFANDPADSRLQVSYYGTEALPLTVEEKTAFENIPACQAGTASILAAYAQLGTRLDGSFCSPDEYSASTKFFAIGLVPATGIVWTTVPGVYPSRGACEADEGHMEQTYRAQGFAVAGSVCGYRKGNFELTILSGR